jgi:hypothetical protein
MRRALSRMVSLLFVLAGSGMLLAAAGPSIGDLKTPYPLMRSPVQVGSMKYSAESSRIGVIEVLVTIR